VTDQDLFVGIDCGTSGVRAVAIDRQHRLSAEGACAMRDAGEDLRSPRTWEVAMWRALTALFVRIDTTRVRAIAVDGTSGTLLPVNGTGQPLTGPLMYNDAVADAEILATIARIAPADSAVHGASSGLARFVDLQNRLQRDSDCTPHRILHQADWLSGQLSGRFDVSDQNNALKTGFDAVADRWPAWIADCGADVDLLPEVVAPGTVVGTLQKKLATQYQLSSDVLIVAGTTDGCASFLATGASEAGDAVTALGTTLTIKMLSDKPLYQPEYGLYSHRLGDRWLAGGASNTGGNVLLHYFDSARIQALSEQMDTTTPAKLDYYPLREAGERFPVNDPNHVPRVTPRPDSDVEFLKELFSGIASVEALAYERLQQLGAPRLLTLRSVGGGSSNQAWTRIREQRMDMRFSSVLFSEAAAGCALLALQGAGVTPSPAA